MPGRSTKRILLWSAFAGFLLHTAAALLVWMRWGQGARGLYLVWMDLPLSFAWAGEYDKALLAWSLTVGGAWWAVLTALLTFLVGRVAARSRVGPPQ